LTGTHATRTMTPQAETHQSTGLTGRPTVLWVIICTGQRCLNDHLEFDERLK
jgi:hypothetical protein